MSATERALRLLRSPWTRVVVTVGLLAVVAGQVDWDALSRRVTNGSPTWMLAAVASIVAALAVGAVRWWVLLRPAGIDLCPAAIARVYAISTFSSTFLPTSVGGDVARALLVTRERRQLVRVGLTVVVDRAAALTGMLLVAWIGVAIEPDAAPKGTVPTLALVTALVAVVGLGMMWAAGSGSASARRLVPDRLTGVAREVRDIVAIYRRARGAVAAAVGLSVVFQALVTAQLCAIAESFGIGLSFAAAAVTLTLVTIATLIPVSIAGFGIREGSYVLILAGVGINATDATAISLATVAVLLVASLPGALLLAFRGMTPELR